MYRYLLNGNNLCDLNNGNIQNRQFKLFTKRQINKLKYSSTKYIDEGHYAYIYIDNNLGHFLHDSFLLFYSQWKLNKKRIYFKLYNQYFYDYVKAIIGEEYLIKIEDDVLYYFKNLHIVKEHISKNLQHIQNYIGLLKEIKTKCFNYYNIIENRTEILMYGREDLSRKKLLNINYDKLKETNITSITNMSSLTFEETLKLLSKCGIFIYVFGAGIFYLQFLDNNVNVLEIHSNIGISWTSIYGLSNICNLQIYVSKNTCENEISKKGIGQKIKELDKDIIYDNNLEKYILNYIS